MKRARIRLEASPNGRLQDCVQAQVARLGDRLGAPIAGAVLESVHWLLQGALDLLESFEPPATSAGSPAGPTPLAADALRQRVRAQGPLEKARWIVHWRRHGHQNQEIAAWLGVRSERRVDQLVALLQLAEPVQELIRRYRLTERILRPLLPFQRRPHFPTLVEWAGLYGLTCRQVESWCQRLTPGHECGEALMHLRVVLNASSRVENDSLYKPMLEPFRTQ